MFIRRDMTAEAFLAFADQHPDKRFDFIDGEIVQVLSADDTLDSGAVLPGLNCPSTAFCRSDLAFCGLYRAS